MARLPHGCRRRALAERLETQVLPAFAGRILAFDQPAAQTYADLMAKAKAVGQAIADCTTTSAANFRTAAATTLRSTSNRKAAPKRMGGRRWSSSSTSSVKSTPTRPVASTRSPLEGIHGNAGSAPQEEARAEFFVAGELLKRGLQTSITFGNAEAIDIFAHSER